MKTKKWSQEQLDILYECWKDGKKPRNIIPLIQKRLPNSPLPKALGLIRKLSKTDPKWVGWITRTTNKEENKKLIQQQEKEQKRLEKEKKKQLRAEKKKLREEKKAKKELKHVLKRKVLLNCSDEIKEKINPEFFFCSDVGQFVNNNSCIVRVFGGEHEGFSHGGPCDKCNRMDKYIPIIEEIANGRQEKKLRKHSTSSGPKDKK
jgi:hypothetical protein